jgi:hypothetical protein
VASYFAPGGSSRVVKHRWFFASGSWDPPAANTSAAALIIAGGGSGAAAVSATGGGWNTGTVGNDGGNSSALGVTATGGKGGTLAAPASGGTQEGHRGSPLYLPGNAGLGTNQLGGMPVLGFGGGGEGGASMVDNLTPGNNMPQGGGGNSGQIKWADWASISGTQTITIGAGGAAVANSNSTTFSQAGQQGAVCLFWIE